MSNNPGHKNPLRAKAEAELARLPLKKMMPRPAKKLLHELQVHQIELEMQNEALRESQISLEESRDRYVDFYDFAPTGYVTLNSAGLISEINLTGAELFGIERGKLKNRRFSPLVASEERDHWHRFFVSVINENDKLTCELPLLRGDGTRFFAQLDCLRLPKDGKAAEVRIVLTDISERKKTDDMLRFHSEILKNVAEGIFLIRASDGTIVYANPRFEHMFGYDSGEIIGKHVSVVNAPTDTSPEARAKEISDELLKTGRWSGEIHNIRKDGRTFWSHANVSTYEHPDFGRVWVSVHDDIDKRKELEHKLRESEKRRHLLEQQDLVHASIDGFWVVNARDGKILEVNDNYCNMMGYSQQEVLSMGIKGLDVIEKPDETKARINRIQEVGYDRFETRHRHKQGHLVDFEVSVSHSGANGGINFAFFHDVTERNRMVEALRRSELNYRILFENSRDAMIIAMAVSPQHFISVNHSAMLMFGAKNEAELVGARPWELSPELQPDGLESAVKARQMIEIAIQNGSHFFEWTHQRLNGETFPTEILLTRLEQDGQTCIQATIRDITERKHIEEYIRQSREQLSTFIQQAPISIAMFDRNMNYLAVSNRWIKDYSRGYANLIGLNHYAVHPDMPEKWKIVHQQALAGATLEDKDEMWVQADGSKHWLRWSVLPWTDQNNEIGGIIVSTENITDSKRLEIELTRHRDEMESLQKMHVAAQTASAVAHEINQPLLAITSYSKAGLMIMKGKHPDYDKVCDALEKSEQQALRAGRSIRDLINFLNRKDFPTEPFDLNQEIASFVATVKSEHNLAFHSILRLEEGLPLVRANRTHIQKVLLNLLRNGIDAMEAAGVPLPAITVTICTSKDQNFAQMTIQDNGPGVKKEDIDRLFEPFFTTKSKGIGMGLAISRSLVEENGGKLWVETQEGQGATFHLTLPFAT